MVPVFGSLFEKKWVPVWGLLSEAMGPQFEVPVVNYEVPLDVTSSYINVAKIWLQVKKKNVGKVGADSTKEGDPCQGALEGHKSAQHTPTNLCTFCNSTRKPTLRYTYTQSAFWYYTYTHTQIHIHKSKCILIYVNPHSSKYIHGSKYAKYT